MSYLFTDPTTVLLVGGSSDERERVRDAVTGGTATTVRSVPSVEAGVEAVRTRDDAGCVVVLASDDVSACCDFFHDANDQLPLVFHVADVDDRLLESVAERRHARYLPRSADDDVVRSVVDDALAEFDERRCRAAESGAFTTLLSDIGVSIYVKDDEGRHIYTADTDEALTSADAIGKTDLDLVPDQFSEVARRTYQDDLNVVETGEPVYDRVEHYDSSDEFWTETSKVPWRDDDGEIQGLVGITLDVTGREQARQDLEREKQRVDRFVTYVSHDLRTPLQIAIGALDHARTGEGAAFDRLESAHDRIQEVVADLGTLAQDDHLSPESSAVETRTGIPSTKLVPLVESIWESMDTAEATLATEIPDLTTVVACRQLLRPLLENLLKNSVDHGGPDVTVRVGVADDPPGFFVADDGPGIPEDERTHVTDEGYTTTDMGTGTGLSIVRETVDHLDWDLAITESEAGGADFEITDCHLVTMPSTGGRLGEPIPLSESVDVGSPKLSGQSAYDEETDSWTVFGGGFNVWARTNEFHYVCGRVDGPVRIQARINDFDGVQEYSKAGVMVRDGLDEEAAQAFVGTTTEHGTELLWRRNSDEPTRSDQLEEPAGTNWYRVDFVDGRAVIAVSVDGKEWQPIAQHAIDATDPVYVGLVVCSHSNETRSEATFADVTACRLDVDD